MDHGNHPQEPSLPFEPARTVILACATVIEEMLPHVPADVACRVLDFGLHIRPTALKEALQAAIDALPVAVETVILGYGLCSQAVVGLRARDCTLVVPRVDDCIAIFLGSDAAYRRQQRAEPGTYYLTKGWIEVSDTLLTEYERVVEQYGQKRADRVMELMLDNYTRLAYIDTGHQDQARYRAYARRAAETLHLRYEEVVGSDALVQKMIFGPWDDDFVVAQPGETITYLDFKTES